MVIVRQMNRAYIFVLPRTTLIVLTDTKFTNSDGNRIQNDLNHNISYNSCTKTFETIGIDAELDLRNNSIFAENRHIMPNIIRIHKISNDRREPAIVKQIQTKQWTFLIQAFNKS